MLNTRLLRTMSGKLCYQSGRALLHTHRIGSVPDFEPVLAGKRPARSSSLKQSSIAWLDTIARDNSPPPTLFAWTAANLKPSCRSPHVATPNDVASIGEASERIYVLGVGNLGRLLATSLSEVPTKPPITLVVHRKSLLEHWDLAPGIEMIRNGKMDRFTDFDVEWWTGERPQSGPVQELTPIDNLIIATKAADVMPQIDRLRRYLHDASTVAFLQNGMCKLWPPTGEVYQRLRFPNRTGPSWLACVTTHGVVSVSQFRSVHASVATISIGPVSAGAQSGDKYQYLLSQIAQAPQLAARVVSAGELWASQLEKLVINSVINPMTAILDYESGELFVDRGDRLQQVVDALIREASIVLTSLVLDSTVQKIINGDTTDELSREDLDREALIRRFSFSSLQHLVYDVGRKLRSHISSMLQDVRAGKQTEIQEYNGWLIKAAESLGHEMPTHQKMVTIVEDGVRLSRKQLIQYCISL